MKDYEDSRPVFEAKYNSRCERGPDGEYVEPIHQTGWEHWCRALEYAAQQLAEELSKLKDPVAVHINMLRGTIATPTPQQMEHVWGHAPPAAVPLAKPASPQGEDGERGGGEQAPKCPECDGQGFTVTPDREGEPELSQCRTCWERENSPQPEPQSAEEWVRERIIKIHDDLDQECEIVEAKDALDLARRCDLLTQNNEDAQKLVHEYHYANESLHAQLAAAQAEARDLSAVLREIKTCKITPLRDACFYMQEIARAVLAKHAKEAQQ